MANTLGRRSVLTAIGAAIVGTPAFSQGAYPTRPIRMIVPFSAGTGSDGLMRAMSGALGDALGTTILIDNRPGAGGMLGSTAGAKAKPDGYTVLLATQALGTAVHMTASPPFDPSKDLLPVVKVADAPFIILVGRDSKFDSFQAIVSAGKLASTKLTFATNGPGSASHLGTEILKREFGFDATAVPYKDSPQAMLDASQGRVSFAFANVPIARGLLATGDLRIVATGAAVRMPAYPTVPTFAELLNKPDFTYGAWYGFVVPAETPRQVVVRLEEAIIKVLSDPAIKESVERALGGGIVAITRSEPFGRRMREEKEYYGKLMADLGVSAR